MTQPVALAGVLYSKKLINWHTNNEIITRPASNADKAAWLMNAVEAKMKSEADLRAVQVLREMCRAIETDPILKHVSDSIRSELG